MSFRASSHQRSTSRYYHNGFRGDFQQMCMKKWAAGHPCRAWQAAVTTFQARCRKHQPCLKSPCQRLTHQHWQHTPGECTCSWSVTREAAASSSGCIAFPEHALKCSRKERGASKLKLFRKSAVKLADDLGRKTGYKGGQTGASPTTCSVNCAANFLMLQSLTEHICSIIRQS